MKKLRELYGILADQTEKISSDMNDDQLKQEVKRSQAMADTSKQAINIANIILKADNLNHKYGIKGRIDEIIG